MPRVERSISRPHAIRVLAGFFVATFSVAGVSSAFTIRQIPTWYATLDKPSFNPPNQIFGPVWSLLYALMALAAWRVWRLPSSPARRRALQFFWLQLVLNLMWSLLFFGAHKIALAGVEILLLWAAIAVTTVLFFRLDRAAGGMWLLYLAWVSFASVLNLAFWAKN